MKKLCTLMVVLMVLSLGSTAQAENPATPETQDAIDEEILNFPWEHELQEYSLENSHSTLMLTEGFALLRGDAARRFDFLVQGVEDPETEAVIYNQDTGAQLIFNYYPEGYISLDGWDNLDADALLEQIPLNPELKIGGWLQKPVLNRNDHSVFWVFDVVDGEEKYVNAVSIKLGRRGYEQITWVSSYDNYLKSQDLMAFLVDQQKFKNSYRYADYSVGDKMAEFGIASLVVVTAGGNQPAKAGLAAIFAWLASLGKKVQVLLLVVLGGIGALFKRLFGKSKSRPQPAGPMV